jgi:hypothetical protein
LKLLIGLSLFQTVALTLVALQLVGGERRADVAPTAAPAEARESASFPVFVEASPPAPTIDEIRLVIREELGAAAAPPAGAAGRHAAPVDRPVDPALAAAAARELDLYISRGRIGDQEMRSLEAKAAELPPSEQARLLRNLAKAVNDGRLDIQF